MVDKWHVDKAISLSNILVLAGVAASGFGAYDTLSNRLAVLEINQQNINAKIVDLIERQVTTDREQNSDLLLFRQEMREDSKLIQQKLDKILEERP